jgi:hypothetical protein
VMLLDRLEPHDPAVERSVGVEIGAMHIHEYCRTGKRTVLRLRTKNDEPTRL